ncbi:hypothetical protein NSB25_09215 [Acetatifactor muris]|uniref:Uncharacterized protein n=1 Tax=Acetatifactor muris TaxID=879566 RepID=A0A2K4ZA67_9FIRM|nr:hypothetical protein [Acetatifactor muris]MCR2047457.1 hypothetical protein [Acetatifactor muris]SOY27352.1 hypothetical protein AMURIS_00056 [Acetatifactor muris]
MRGYREEGKGQHITSFYMETLVLALIFIAVILVLTKVFALSGQMSGKAKVLTNAVHLAENAAEALAASDSLEMLAVLLEEDGNVEILRQDGQEVLQARYDEKMKPAADGSFLVEVLWVPEAGNENGLTQGVINVSREDSGEQLYMLKTAVYMGH